MAWFKVRLVGEGLKVAIPQRTTAFWGLVSIDRKVPVSGFYATRHIQARDADEALALALSRVKLDLSAFKSIDASALESLDLKLDGVEVVEPVAIGAEAQGFTFFSGN